MSLSIELSQVPTGLPACPPWCTAQHSPDDLAPLDVARRTWGLLHAWSVGTVQLRQLVEIDSLGTELSRETWIDVPGLPRLVPADAGVLATDLLEATIRVFDTR